MRKFLLALLSFAALAVAQDYPLSWASSSAFGNITKSASDCASPACVWIVVPVNTGGVSVQLSGTFSATVQFESSVGGSVWTSIASTANATSATSAGTYAFALSGQQYFRVRSSSFSSGPIRVDIAATSAPVQSGGGGGTPGGSDGQLQVNSSGAFAGTSSIPAGITVAVPQWVEVRAGVCQSSTPALAFDLPTSNAPTPTCKTGTNVQMGVASFTATGQTVQGSLVLPDDYTSILGIEFRFLSETAASVGNVVWNFTYACVSSSGGSIDPSFASAQTATVAAGANNAINLATLSTPTISGCSGGQRMYYKIGLDGTTTASGNQDLIAVRVKAKRTITAL